MAHGDTMVSFYDVGTGQQAAQREFRLFLAPTLAFLWVVAHHGNYDIECRHQGRPLRSLPGHGEAEWRFAFDFGETTLLNRRFHISLHDVLPLSKSKLPILSYPYRALQHYIEELYRRTLTHLCCGYIPNALRHTSRACGTERERGSPCREYF